MNSQRNRQDALMEKMVVAGEDKVLFEIIEDLINSVDHTSTAPDYQVIGAQFDLLRSLKYRFIQRIRRRT